MRHISKTIRRLPEAPQRHTSLHILIPRIRKIPRIDISIQTTFRACLRCFVETESKARKGTIGHAAVGAGAVAAEVVPDGRGEDVGSVRGFVPVPWGKTILVSEMVTGRVERRGTYGTPPW